MFNFQEPKREIICSWPSFAHLIHRARASHTAVPGESSSHPVDCWKSEFKSLKKRQGLYYSTGRLAIQGGARRGPSMGNLLKERWESQRTRGHSHSHTTIAQTVRTLPLRIIQRNKEAVVTVLDSNPSPSHTIPQLYTLGSFPEPQIKNCSYLQGCAVSIRFEEDRKDRTQNGQMMMPLHCHLSIGSPSP